MTARSNGDNLLFQSETPPASSFGDRLLVTRKITVAGRPWTILFRPTSAFSQPSSRAIPVMLGLFGLLLAGAIALVARYQERAYDAASRLHETTEKSLLEKDLMLQEMKHRIKNSITRVLAIARQTASRATDVNEFSSSFSARLQAMAASQDMLTRSRWQKADLGDLLRIELGQVFGKELPEGLLSGPEVLLDETTTQALGLTFHELATNALKYGEAGNSSRRAQGRLVARRARARQDAGSQLARSRAEETRGAGQDRLRHQADRPQRHARTARHDQARFSGQWSECGNQNSADWLKHCWSAGTATERPAMQIRRPEFRPPDRRFDYRRTSCSEPCRSGRDDRDTGNSRCAGCEPAGRIRHRQPHRPARPCRRRPGRRYRRQSSRRQPHPARCVVQPLTATTATMAIIIFRIESLLTLCPHFGKLQQPFSTK